MMLIRSIQRKLSSKYIKNTGWLGSAELANRIFRLGTTVVLARTFSQEDYGLLAIVMTVYEFANVLTCKAGISSKLVQAKQEDLETLSETAYWMSWLASAAIFVMQCILSVFVGWFYSDYRVVLPICFIGLSHLMVPLFTVQISRIERDNRLSIIAICNASQQFLMNVLTIIFAVLGFGIWSIVLSIIISSPTWAIIGRINEKWRPQKSFTLYRCKEVTSYAANIIGSDFLVKLRDNLDYLLVGRFLGVEALGIYYFAFNAGLGISLSIINSLTWSLWPHLCDARENLLELKSRYLHGLKVIASVIIPFVIFQSSLAPFYVPIIFSEKWLPAIPILIIVCASAIPRPFFLASFHLLNAINRPNISFLWSLSFTLVYSISLLIGVSFGIIETALAVLASQYIVTPIFMVWSYKYTFKSLTSGSTS